MTVVPGYEYVVTTTSSCTVTDDATGTELVTAYAGQQAVFQAIGESITLSDPEAIVKVRRSPFESTPGGALSLAGGSVLPAGYTRLEFLESTGKQYIDTDIVPTASTGLLLDNQLTAQEDTMPFGCRNSGSSDTRFYACRAPRQVDRVAYMGYGWGAWSAYGPAEPGVRALTKLNWFQAGTVEGLGLKRDLAPLSFTPTQTLYLFAANIGGSAALLFRGRIWQAGVTEASKRVRRFIPALTPDGTPCMYDLVTPKPFRNNGTGQFIAGVKDTAQLSTVLHRLPATGGELKLSLPAEANTPEVAELLQQCQDTTGWLLTVYEYRTAAAVTYSLRRVRQVVWCRVAEDTAGNYVSFNGERFNIERCAAIFGPLGQDPTAYGYTPFDSVEQAAEAWGLQPYVYPEEAEPTMD